jgi:hypothetical protein
MRTLLQDIYKKDNSCKIETISFLKLLRMFIFTTVLMSFTVCCFTEY